MPTETGSVSIFPKPPESTMSTPAAKNAKIGRTAPLLAKLSFSVKRCVIGSGSDFLCPVGTTMPRATPAIVAWTPDMCMQYQARMARGQRNHQWVILLAVRNPKAATRAMAPPSQPKLTPPAKNTAMTMMPPRSSATARVMRKVRAAGGRPRPKIARIASAKAMSVATGTAQPPYSPEPVATCVSA